MPVGSIVMSEHYIGFLVEKDDTYGLVRGSNGNDRVVELSGLHEVCNPHSIALMFYNKLVERVNHGKTN